VDALEGFIGTKDRTHQAKDYGGFLKSWERPYSILRLKVKKTIIY
jgi:hypothetical protein